MPSRCNFYIGVSPHQQIIGVEVVGLLKLHGALEVLFNPDGWHAQDTEQQERATTRIGGFSGGNGFFPQVAHGKIRDYMFLLLQLRTLIVKWIFWGCCSDLLPWIPESYDMMI